MVRGIFGYIPVKSTMKIQLQMHSNLKYAKISFIQNIYLKWPAILIFLFDGSNVAFVLSAEVIIIQSSTYFDISRIKQ